VIYSILKEIDPFAPGRKPMSVGILIRVNSTAIELAEALRTLTKNDNSNLQITVDGKLEPARSMAFSVYSQLLRLAYHPGDQFAKEFLRMCVLTDMAPDIPAEQQEAKPVGLDGFASMLNTTAEDLPAAIRLKIQQSGLAAFTQLFIDSFSDKLTDFDLSRMNAVRDNALSFQGTTDEFLDLQKEISASENSIGSTVQIMTIHKSKGLGFDIVFLPELEPGRGNDFGMPEYCAPDEDESGNGGWISYLPVGAVSDLIPEFQQFKNNEEGQGILESACTLYVALTRAKRALYMLTCLPDKSPAEVFRPDKTVTATLAGCESSQADDPVHQKWAEETAKVLEEHTLSLRYSNGIPDWYRSAAEKANHVETKSLIIGYDSYSPDLVIVDSQQNIMKRKVASLEHLKSHQSDSIYRFAENTATDLGTEIHEILAKVEYTEDIDLESLLIGSNASDEANDIVRKAWGSPSIRNALARPAGNAVLWRERRFLLRGEEGELIPGAFDRVIIFRDDEGNPDRAEIYDYKSDKSNDPAEFLNRHAEQLNIYRESLAELLGIETDAIDCTILALRPGLAIVVPPEQKV